MRDGSSGVGSHPGGAPPGAWRLGTLCCAQQEACPGPPRRGLSSRLEGVGGAEAGVGGTHLGNGWAATAVLTAEVAE